MVPDKFNMVDMGGIDLILMQGEEVPGLYDRLVESIIQCRYQCLYNWLFDGVIIPPTYVELEVNENDEVAINEGVVVTSDDIIHIYSIEPPTPEPEIIPLLAEENGTYTVPVGKDGFNPVTVDVPSYTPVINSITITENGTYTAPTGVDGYSPVSVNVSGSILPDQYQRVAYVQGDGSGAYIDTGVNPDANTTVFLQAIYKVLSDGQFLFGSRVGRRNAAFDLLVNSTSSTDEYRFRVDYGADEPPIAQPSDASYVDIIFGSEAFSVNGLTPSVAPSGFTGNQYSIYLFAGNNGGTVSSLSTMKCFSFAIKSGSTLIRNFIPCKKISNDEVGFYDLVTSTFYGNAGTGAFVAGPNTN